MSTLSISTQYILDVFAGAIRQLKEIKGIQIAKAKVKASLFTDNMSLYKKDPKNDMGNI